MCRRGAWVAELKARYQSAQIKALFYVRKTVENNWLRAMGLLVCKSLDRVEARDAIVDRARLGFVNIRFPSPALGREMTQAGLTPCRTVSRRHSFGLPRKCETAAAYNAYKEMKEHTPAE